MGVDKFYRKAHISGVNGVLAADLPPEEASIAIEAARNNGVNQIFLAAQSTSNERLKKIVELCSGFLYVVSVMGVTGARSQLKVSTVELVERMRIHTQLPICVGFGISKPEHVREVIAAGADGAIVGSALIDVMVNNVENSEFRVRECCQIMKNATKVR
jgi:tryptophan synthase alpha chain